MTVNQMPTAAVRAGFMRRDDGMVLPFNADVWNGDQRTKKRWKRCAEIPADFVEAQNAQKEQEGLRQAALEAARELADERKKIAIAEQSAARKRAKVTPTKITPAMRAAQDKLDAEQKGEVLVLDIGSMTSEQLMKVAEEQYHTSLDPSKTHEELQLEVARLAGVTKET